MQEYHVMHEQMERFLRAESTRQENREIIRHLLAECPLCRETVQVVARRQGFKVPAKPDAPPLRIAKAG
jgi:PP-loop superfamily ATP-utilizing enzyme